MELGALHYIAAVVTLHAEYLYMELLPKMYGKTKILNSLLKSNALEHFKVLLECGSKKRLFWMWVANGTGWVLGARR